MLIATVHSDQSVEHAFHRLDQVRWERAHLDISGLETESDALARTADLLDELVESEAAHESLACRAIDSRRFDATLWSLGL